MSAKVSVDVFGEVYPLKSEEHDEAYLKQLGAEVDIRMREIASAGKMVSKQKIAVLAALKLADDYLSLQKQYDELVSLIKE